MPLSPRLLIAAESGLCAFQRSAQIALTLQLFSDLVERFRWFVVTGKRAEPYEDAALTRSHKSSEGRAAVLVDGCNSQITLDRAAQVQPEHRQSMHETRGFGDGMRRLGYNFQLGARDRAEIRYM